ncbi:MAG: Malonyl CoA-acyl carrier protein transacylase [uncultured Frankineae bacterium]|uniref:[acyl-carrier-protein] S-malonyltransferase n=1 Tax=uncultured Frankineae bacterium TaxID=437475 RepID=A0A6J4MMN8_9ACTN|nr:MAG: Malonyl CoA-acyl carrier protein transacylase [uncultured Frankineae bacterium]
MFAAEAKARDRPGTLEDVPLLLSPGQGSQSAGMLTPWLDLPDARPTVERWSDRTGLDLIGLGTSASADEVRATEVAQPLLTVVALLSGRALLGGAAPDAVCGHSIGELSALALAGVMTDDDAVALAAGRGALMAEAAAVRPTTMAAVLGGTVDEDDLAAAGLEVATVNVPGQVVVGGPVEALDAWTPPAGARVRRLDVAGAFHTSAMAPAVDGFTALVEQTAATDAVCDVVANGDGAVLRDGRELMRRLVGQLTRPVRFDLCLQSLSASEHGSGATEAVELAPAGVLAGMAKRALPGVPVTALRTPADLPVHA